MRRWHWNLSGHNRAMPVKDVCALLLGLAIAVGAAVLAQQVRDAEESMRWEAGFAVGFAALISLGPFWIAQAVLTVLATLDDVGMVRAVRHALA